MLNPVVFVNKKDFNSYTCEPRTAAVPLVPLDAANTDPS